jgi:hypothetical protein
LNKLYWIGADRINNEDVQLGGVIGSVFKDIFICTGVNDGCSQRIYNWADHSIYKIG